MRNSSFILVRRDTCPSSEVGRIADSDVSSNPTGAVLFEAGGRNLIGNKFKCGDYVLWKKHHQKGRIQGDRMIDGSYHVAVQGKDGIEIIYAEEDELDFDPDSLCLC